MSDLSKNLRQLLTFFNLSENELGRRSGVPQQVINRILTEKNQNPKISTLTQIAKYFSLTVSQLLGEEALPIEPRMKQTTASAITKIPLLKWTQLSALTKEMKSKKNPKIITDAVISEQTFALLNPDDAMEPKFSVNAILIFDCQPIPKYGDYVLVYNEKSKTALFRQLWLKNHVAYVKSLNLKHTEYKVREVQEVEKIIAVLIQSRTDFL